jgi:hypothetical protein
MAERKKDRKKKYFTHFDEEVQNGYSSFLPMDDCILEGAARGLGREPREVSNPSLDELYRPFQFVQHATSLDSARSILREGLQKNPMTDNGIASQGMQGHYMNIS